ncbi:hypothetical protein AA637_01410 [Cyanobacterium sp. HL-69]|uniref:hypothetical protein n=1 Tax=Cyanobacterium sp. HL-69 TaxID=2054282 RepID=UPI000CA13400|nr:hypothetical protein AA637_01410 [Cyanobacterium sp. HL-69]
MAKKISKAFRDLQSLPATKVKGKLKINRKNSNDEHLDAYAQELKAIYPDRKIIRRKDGQFKISAVFWDFLESEKDLIYEDIEKGRAIVSIAIAGWNLALLPEEEREKEIQSLTVTNGIEKDNSGDIFFRDLVRDFVERKLKYFNDLDVFISDFQLREVNGEMRLSIVSMVG